MKTKRSIFSIIVFLSVFWISNLVGSDTFRLKEREEQTNENPLIREDNTDSQAAYESSLNSFSNKHGDVASTSDRLYIYEEANPEPLTDQETDHEDDLYQNEPTEESTVSEHSLIDEAPVTQDESVDTVGTPDIKEEVISQDKKPETSPSAYQPMLISAFLQRNPM